MRSLLLRGIHGCEAEVAEQFGEAVGCPTISVAHVLGETGVLAVDAGLPDRDAAESGDEHARRYVAEIGGRILSIETGLLAPQAASAQAFYLQEQSSRGAGRAFSGEVADQGVQSLWWNPAAIAGMEGVDAHQAVSVILPKGSVDNVNKPTFGLDSFLNFGGIFLNFKDMFFI